MTIEARVKIDFSGTKADELRLLESLLIHRPRQGDDGEFADHYSEQLNIPYNRFYKLLLKWGGKEWWDYGVSLRSGWFTDLGLEAAKQASDWLIKKSEQLISKESKDAIRSAT